MTDRNKDLENRVAYLEGRVFWLRVLVGLIIFSTFSSGIAFKHQSNSMARAINYIVEVLDNATFVVHPGDVTDE